MTNIGTCDTEKLLRIRVSCDAGQRENPPQRFFIGTRKIEVIEIIDRWLETDYGYFKIQGDDGGTYILKNDVLADDWELTLYDSGDYPVPQANSAIVKTYI